MATRDEEGSSALGTLSQNWRSALVVNGLFEALEETERQRDELAQNLSKREAGPSLFDTADNGTLGGEDRWPQNGRDSGNDADRFDGGSRSLGGSRTEPRNQAPPPLLRHSLFAPALSLLSPPPPPPPPPTAAASPTTQNVRASNNSSSHDNGTNNSHARFAAAAGERQSTRQHPTRGQAEARNDGDRSYDEAGSPKQALPPPPPRPPERTRSGISRFRDSRNSSIRGGGGGAQGDAAARARGVRSGGKGLGEGEERADVGLSAFSVGSLAGELRGGELELVRGRVADLGAAIETSQSKLLRELSQVQEDFFSSFGYTPPLGASAAAKAGGGGSGGGVGFPSFPSSIDGAGSYDSAGVTNSKSTAPYNSNTGPYDRARSPRRGRGFQKGSGGGTRGFRVELTASTSPRARSPLRRRDLDTTAEQDEEGSQPRSGSYHRVGMRLDRGTSGGVRGSGSVGTRPGGGAATIDGAAFAFPAAASVPLQAARRGRTRDAGDENFRSGGASSPGMARRTWRSASPSPRAANASGDGWSAGGTGAEGLGGARRSHVQFAGVGQLREQLRTEVAEKEDLARELEDCRREIEELREREERLGGEVEELAANEAEERRARRAAEKEVEQSRASQRSSEEKCSALEQEVKGLERRSSEVERTCAQLEEKTKAQQQEITDRSAELEKESAELQRKTAALRETIAELEETRARLGETKGELAEARGELAETERELAETKGELGEAAAKLGETREELGETLAKLAETKRELEERTLELRDARAELVETRVELGETREGLGETKEELAEKAAALERAVSRVEEMGEGLERAAERQRELESERDQSLQALHDLQGDFDEFQTAASERASGVSERVATALERERRRASLRAAVWQWRAITLKSDLGTAVRLAQGLKLRQAKLRAFRAWVDFRERRSQARMAVLRLLRRQTAVDQREALRHWARQAAAAAAAAAASEISRAEAERARSTAAAVLLEGLARGRRRRLQGGVDKLREGVAASRMKSQALRRISIACHRRDLGSLSVALSLWWRRSSSRRLTEAALRRVAGIRVRRELTEALRRWAGAAGAERALEGLAAMVERAVRRARVARALRRWREECSQQRAAETKKKGERFSRVLSGRLASAGRRQLLLRCLLGWKAHAVTRRRQLRSARSFLLARNNRVARAALVAWRDGRRRRADAVRKLWRLDRACRTAALREGLRRLSLSARIKERKEAEMIVLSAKLETEELRRDRDGMSVKLQGATEDAHRATQQRVKVEKELVRRQRLSFGKECFAAWKGVVRAEKRKKSSLVKLMHRNRRWLLQEAYALWRDDARDATTLAKIEHMVVRNAQRKSLQTTLRAWSDGAKRRRRFASVFLRAARAVRSLEERQQREAFSAWRATTAGVGRRFVDISGACARLRAVRKRPGRLQLASAFSLWARLSAAASHSDRRAETAASAKRHRNLRLCLSTLRGNASLRRRARLALTSLDRRCRLRRLSRGWTAVVGAAAAGSAERRGELRLGRAEAAVAAGRMAARARAHRTARRLLGVARGRAALEAFVAWRGLVREGRGARLGAAALAGRSRRRKLRETFACWRREAVASSRLRSRALSRISQATEGLVSEAFSVWRQGSAAARGKARALATLAGISNRRRSKRADMRLALRNWRRNACVDGGPTGDDDGGRGQDRGGDYGEVAGAGGLEAMAGVFVEATAAFSSASSVPQVFDLVERFVSEVAFSSDGRLLLLNGEPGGGMFCLEADSGAPPDQDPLETCFPIGDGIVARCVATGLAFQTRYGGSSSSGGVPDPPSARGLYHNTNANAGVTNIGTTLNLALAGPADLHALPLPDGYNIGSPSYRYAAVAANGAAPPPPHPQPLSAAFRGWKKGATTDAGPESASTVPPPPASWEDRRNRAPGGDSPVPDSGGGRGRSRLAFFPASDGYGSSRSPSPAGRAGLGGSRGYGFMSSSPPPAGEAAAGRGTRFWSKSESSPSPGRNRQHQRRQRSPSLARRGRTGAAAAAAEDEEGAVVAVACLPVTGGAGGQAMMGVLKVWREQQQQQQQRHQACGGHRTPDQGFSGGEMAALSVLAGQAAAALRRLGAEATDRDGVLGELDAAAAERNSEAQKRDAQVKKEMERLREAMEHVSGSAKGLARQRDDARAALAKAKGTLRRMVPALREVRDRQLGFRHYHDLIVNMSRAVLQDDVEEHDAEGQGDRHSAAPTPRCRNRGCAGGCEVGTIGACSDGVDGGGNGECRRATSVGRQTSPINGSNGGITGRRIRSPESLVRGRSGNRTPRHGSGGGGGGGCRSAGGAALIGPSPRRGTSGGSAPRSEVGFKVTPSPDDRAAAAMSLARSGGNGGDLEPAILAALRETAAAGGGVARGERRVR